MRLTDIEINELKEDKKAGRVQITMTALTIHKRGEWNRRGMTWLRENVERNMESIIGAPFVVCFLDDSQTLPSGHGTLTYSENGECEFEDSDTVGTILNAWIEEVEIEGDKREKLVCTGSLYKQRYPRFVEWLQEEVKHDCRVKGSIEVNGKGDSKEIIYEHGNGHNPDGTWEMGRVPVIFDFTGLCILLPDVVREADPGSEVIELNSDDTKYNENLDENINKEETPTMAEINNTDSIVELNDRILNQANEINELKSQLDAKNVELNEYKKELEDCKAELNSSKEKEVELNELLVEANKSVEANKAEIAELNSELEPLREMKTKIDSEKAQAEVNAYFETIKKENGFSEAELNSLKEDYVDKCDLAGLKAKETEICVARFKEMKKADKVVVEVNSTETDDNLFFSTKVEIVETNAANDDGSDLFK